MYSVDVWRPGWLWPHHSPRGSTKREVESDDTHFAPRDRQTQIHQADAEMQRAADVAAHSSSQVSYVHAEKDWVECWWFKYTAMINRVRLIYVAVEEYTMWV